MVEDQQILFQRGVFIKKKKKHTTTTKKKDCGEVHGLMPRGAVFSSLHFKCQGSPEARFVSA